MRLNRINLISLLSLYAIVRQKKIYKTVWETKQSCKSQPNLTDHSRALSKKEFEYFFWNSNCYIWPPTTTATTLTTTKNIQTIILINRPFKIHGDEILHGSGTFQSNKLFARMIRRFPLNKLSHQYRFYLLISVTNCF